MIYELIIGGWDRDGRYYWYCAGKRSFGAFGCIIFDPCPHSFCSFGGMEVEEASPARQATVEPTRYQFRHEQSIVDSLLSHIYFIAVEFVPLSTRNAKSDSQLLSGLFSGSHWQQVLSSVGKIAKWLPVGSLTRKGNGMRFRFDGAQAHLDLWKTCGD